MDKTNFAMRLSLTRRRFAVAGVLGSTAFFVRGLRPARAADKPKIGLVQKSLANEFFKQMQAGAEKYAAANTDKFEFKAVGMKDERDFAAQVDAIENFVTQKYDIIVVAPADSKAMVTPIAKALKAGVKVINIDVELDKDAKKAAGIDLAFFGPDNRAGAKMAGDALAQKLGAGGKVVILEGNPEADNAVQRKLGFMDSVNEGKLQLLDSKTAHWETEEANTLMTNFLTQYHDIQGVMAANDSMALGVVKALDAAGLSGKIQVVAFDNIPAVQPLDQERQDAGDHRTVRRRHGGARHQLRPEREGGRDLHRLGQDADQVDRGQGPSVAGTRRDGSFPSLLGKVA